MSLSPEWVEIVFTKLTMVYGQRFAAQYGNLPLESIKADWSQELAGLSADGIKYALHNLPRDFPPNVLQFRDLCHRRPLPVFKALPGPDGDQQIARAALDALEPLLRGNKGMDPKAWAKRLRNRELRGDSLSEAQRLMWRRALGEAND